MMNIVTQSDQAGRSAPGSGRVRRRLMTGGAMGLCLVALAAHAPLRAQAAVGGQAFQGTPTVVSGNAAINQTATLDTITVTTPQAVINWRPNDRTGTGTIDFLPAGLRGLFIGSSDFTVLNRILPVDGNDMPITRMIALNGIIDSQIVDPLTGATSRGGNVWFYNAGGILVGSSGVINVGSLVLSARDIDTTGGLFGSNGEIRFRDPTTAGAGASRIEIAPGAIVSASRDGGASAYIALVAPRIVQGGGVFADGSVGLIAAEQADVRINNGLFDITVTVGTSDANGIVHSGTTGGILDASGAHVAYLVAVPKNQAMTMLLSGDIGFVAGQSASMNAAGNIVISAGHNVGGTVIGPAANQNGTASATIGDVIFRNRVIGQASDSFALRSILSCAPFCSSFSPQGQILFNGGASLSARSAINVSVGQAQQIVSMGNLSLLAADAATGQGGSIVVSMNNAPPLSPSTSGGGVMLVTGDLLLDASANGHATMTGDATGGSVTVDVVNGMLSANRLIALANGTAGSGMSQGAAGGGPTGHGGSVTVVAGQGGLISVSDLFARADGDAQTGFGPDGSDGIGGTVRLEASDGGSLSVTNQLVASATGTGTLGTAQSGMGMGGTVNLSVVGATSSVSSGSTLLDASGFGGGIAGQSNTSSTPETMIGGGGMGGTVRVTNAGTANLGSLTAIADGVGGSANSFSSTATPLGGAGTGGTIEIEVTDGTTTIADLALFASAIGGGVGGGGGATAVADGGVISVTASDGGRLQVNGTSHVETRATAESHGGGAVSAVTGGTISIRAITDGSIIFGGRATFDATADARQRQFNTAASTAAAATGGVINLEADGGFLSFSGVNAHADAIASHGTMVGGAATGGRINLRAMNGGVLNHSSSFDSYSADGDAGSGQTGGNGRGGAIALMADAGSLNFGQFTSFQARGEGGQSFDGIHLAMGQGGDISLHVTGDADSRLTFGTINLDTSGSTSLGGEGFVNLGDGAEARGGNIDIIFAGTVFGSSLNASAVGGGLGRGDGTGGHISLALLGGDTNISDVGLNADGESSNFLTSDVGGNGFGGSIDIVFTSGSYTGSTISASAQGRGGDGLSAFSQAPFNGGEGGQNFFEVFGGFGGPYVTGQYNAPSNGGDGHGGFINIRADGDADVALFGGLFGDASGIGGEGGNAVADPFTDPATPGNGGRGFGGTIEFDFSSGNLTSGPSSTGGAFISLSANGIGGEGGTLFVDPFGSNNCGYYGCGEGYGNGEGGVVELPTDEGHPDGGLGVGGNVTIVLRGQTDALFAANTSGIGGRGGHSLTGGNGGEGRGGVSTLIADGTDVGNPNFSLTSGGTGGRGGNGINGSGGRGGSGEGGTARAIASGIDAVLRTANGSFDTRGRGGRGGDAFVSEFTAEIPERGGSGGDGGFGAGGTIELLTEDGSIILGEAGEAQFSSTGFGGDGGNGADNDFGPSDVATFGGNAGFAGDGYGGAIHLLAHGGTISVDSSGTLSIDSFGIGGNGGVGGVGNIVTLFDMMGMPIGTAGGNGFSTGSGITLGGTIRLEAMDSDDLAGLIALGDTSLFADGNLAGRIELIDGSSAGAGITFNSLYASAFGGASTSSDFSVAGSGIYISSGSGAISIANDATLETDGEIRFDMADDGGFVADGPLTLRADRLTAIHAVDPDFDGMVATFAGGTVDAIARIVDLRAGSVGRAHGSMTINAFETLGFDQLVSDNGPMLLISGGNLTGGTAKSGGLFSSNSGGDTLITSVVAGTDADIDASGSIHIGDLTTESGFADLNGAGVTIGTGSVASSLRIDSSSIVDLSNVVSGGTATIFAGALVTIGSLESTGGDILITPANGVDAESLVADGSINIVGEGDIDISSAVAGGFINLFTDQDIRLGAATGNNLDMGADGQIDFGTINVGGSANIGAEGNITGVSLSAGGVRAESFGGNIDIDTITSNGQINLTARNGLVTGDLAQTEFGAIFINAQNVDYGTLIAGGLIDVHAANDITVDSATTRNNSGQGSTGASSINGGEQGAFSISTGDFDIVLTAGGVVTLGIVDALHSIHITGASLAGGTSSLTAGDDITVDVDGNAVFGEMFATNGVVDIDAGGDVTGSTVEAGRVDVASSGGDIDIDDIFAFGQVRLTALDGLVTGDSAESLFSSIFINADAVDYGTLQSGGLIDVHADGTINVGSATTRNNAGQGGDGNGGEQGAFSTSTGAFDIIFTAGGAVTLGAIDALDSIHITGGSLAGGTSSLTAGDDITVLTSGNAVFGSALADIGLIDVQAGGSITGTSATTNGGNASFVGTTGVNLGTVRVPGTLLLRATGGNVLVSDLRSGLVTALGQAVDLTTTATNVIDNVEATAGAVTLRGTAGNLTVNTGGATGAFNATTNAGALSVGTVTGGSIALDAATTAALTGNVTATNLLAVTSRQATTVNAVATGGSVRITSGDIVIGASGRVGTGGTTTLVELINGDSTARTFIGGADQANEYSLSAAELQRLFGGNITIRAPRVNAQSGGALGSTRPPDVVIGAFTFTGGGAASGAQLGASGTLSIITPGSVRVVGAAALSNMNSTNGFAIAADDAIEVIMGQGSIRLTGSGPNGLGGTLTLTSEDVAVATMQAITDIAGLTDVEAIDARLAMNDGVTSDDGALIAGAITFDVLDGLYIQNSGVSDAFDDRRGFTANSLNIFTESSSSRIVINGRVGNDMGVLHTGIDAIALTFINDVAGGTQGGYDSLSTINGCVIANPASCSAPDIETSFPVQDVVEEEIEDEEDGDGTPYRSLISLREAPENPEEPVLDDPITGSGNDDLWIPADGG